MKSAKQACALIQETIAWNREMNESDKLHCMSCPKCMEIFGLITELDVFIKESSQPEIPADFADKVMLLIEEEEQSAKDWFDKLSVKVGSLFQLKFVRWALVGSGILFSIFRFFRFFFGYLFAM